MRVNRIVSGGQTGVDRAALDVAAEIGIPSGGWCPKGRRAEDGVISDHYALTETPVRDYAQRTEWNIRDADATLILTNGRLTGGTKLTWQLANDMARPCLLVRIDGSENADRVRRWLRAQKGETLNIAGPRESEQCGVYVRARTFLLMVLEP